MEKHQDDFKFSGKTMPQKDSLLATNLEFVLTKSVERCKMIAHGSVKNVMLFFYSTKRKSKPPLKISEAFKMIPIDYGNEVEGNFVALS